jgi:polyvinyl alcohol dehydrogenase (cytochrome)
VFIDVLEICVAGHLLRFVRSLHLFSQGAPGFMYALDAATGEILWSFASGGSVIDGPSIADGFVYWGSGYHIGTNNNKLYAFTIPGRRDTK